MGFSNYNRRKRYDDWQDPPTACALCQSELVLLRKHDILYGGRIYGDWPFIYYCMDCGASVGCHPHSIYPLGLMADSATRSARQALHGLVDPVWQSGRMSRNDAYGMLAELAGLPPWEAFHIGNLSALDCRAVAMAFQQRQMAEDFQHPGR